MNETKVKRTSLTSCAWCHEFLMRTSTWDNPLKYHVCSTECQKKASAAVQCKEFLKMTPFEQKKALCDLKNWYKKLDDGRATIMKNYLRSTSRPSLKRLPRTTGTIFQAHEEVMKNDPDRFSTDFMLDIINMNNKTVRR